MPLPLQTTTDCVLYYYLSKKREKYKHLVRKANFRRKKPFVKPTDFSSSSLTPTSLHRSMPLSLFISSKPKNASDVTMDQNHETSAVEPSGKTGVYLVLGMWRWTHSILLMLMIIVTCLSIRLTYVFFVIVSEC